MLLFFQTLERPGATSVLHSAVWSSGVHSRGARRVARARLRDAHLMSSIGSVLVTQNLAARARGLARECVLLGQLVESGELTARLGGGRCERLAQELHLIASAVENAH